MHVCSRCSVACSSGHICLWSQGRRSETQRQRLHHVAACVQKWLSILAQWWDYSMQLFYSHALALPLWHNWNETFNTATSGSFSCLIVDFIHVQLNDPLPVCSCGNFSQRSLVTTTGQCFLILGWVLLYCPEWTVYKPANFSKALRASKEFRPQYQSQRPLKGKLVWSNQSLWKTLLSSKMGINLKLILFI